MNRPHHMAATVVLLMEALQQVALDTGDWANGALILVHPDPFSRPEVGTSYETMTHIASHRRALADLRKKQTTAKDVEQGGEENEAGVVKKTFPKKKAKKDGQ